MNKKWSRKFSYLLTFALVLSMTLSNMITAYAKEVLPDGTIIATKEEHDAGTAHEAAPDGFVWECNWVDGYFNHENIICAEEEHTHGMENGCYTQKICPLIEHTHTDNTGSCYTRNVCEQVEHTHSAACCTNTDRAHLFFNHLNGWMCEYCSQPEHTHSYSEGGCSGPYFNCSQVEHTHSSDCMDVWELTCLKDEHVHTEEAKCFEWVPGYYACKLVEISEGEDGTNGNEQIRIAFEVTGRDGKPVQNAKVTLTVRDVAIIWDPDSESIIAKSPTLVTTATTDMNGIAEFKVSGTYDYIISYEVEAAGYSKVWRNPEQYINTTAHKNNHIDVDLTAESYQVRFLNADGSVLKDETVSGGKRAIAPSNPMYPTNTFYNYEFEKWDTNEYLYVTKPLDVTAVYNTVSDTVNQDLYLVVPESTVSRQETTGLSTTEQDGQRGYVHVGTVKVNNAFKTEYKQIIEGADGFIDLSAYSEANITLESMMTELAFSASKGPNCSIEGNIITYTSGNDVYTADLSKVDWYAYKHNTGHVDGEAQWEKGNDEASEGYTVKYVIDEKFADEYELCNPGGKMLGNGEEYAETEKTGKIASFGVVVKKKGSPNNSASADEAVQMTLRQDAAGTKSGKEISFAANTVVSVLARHENGKLYAKSNFENGFGHTIFKTDSEVVITVTPLFPNGAVDFSVKYYNNSVDSKNEIAETAESYLIDKGLLGSVEKAEALAREKSGDLNKNRVSEYDTTTVSYDEEQQVLNVLYTKSQNGDGGNDGGNDNNGGNNNGGYVPPYYPAPDDNSGNTTDPNENEEEVEITDDATPEGEATDSKDDTKDNQDTDGENTDMSDANGSSTDGNGKNGNGKDSKGVNNDQEELLDLEDDATAQGAAAEDTLAQTGTTPIFVFYLIAAALLALACFIKKPFAKRS